MKKTTKQPFISVCTPTFNRRPFIPMMLKCFELQDYPKDKIEWIIIDDGTDKIEDLVEGHPQIKYFKYDKKMTLGKKRNLMHEKSTGSIIIYMDDDDYYPPTRFSHAVETLQKNPRALCAGSSTMFIYFKHINKMYQFGPYGPNHATAATFAMRRELLNQTRYDENASLAEESGFLKQYAIPFVQLDPRQSILVFSHNHNSVDKKKLLDQGGGNNPFVKISEVKVSDLVKDEYLKDFFMNKVEGLLENYEPGRPENKPDVLIQIEELTKKREKMQEEEFRRQVDNKFREMHMAIQQLQAENETLKEKVLYYDNRIKGIITQRMAELKEMKELKEFKEKHCEPTAEEANIIINI